MNLQKKDKSESETSLEIKEKAGEIVQPAQLSSVFEGKNLIVALQMYLNFHSNISYFYF